MGIFTVYCSVTGIPLDVVCDLPEEEAKFYQWCRPVVVLKDGSVTEPGYYDSYGRVIVDDKTYKVIGYDMEEEIEHDGIAITQKTYEIMKPMIEVEFSEKDNLYQKILKNRYTNRIGMISDYIECQQIIITTEDKKDKYLKPVIHGSRDSLDFRDPGTCPENFCRMDDLCSFIIFE